jgi:hypothetical protein
MPDQFTRRRLLRASAATAVGLGGIGTASATTDGDGSDGLDPERIPLIEGLDLRTDRVAPAGLPEQATGIRPGTQMFVTDDGSTGGCTANFVWRDAGDDESSRGGDGDLPEGTNVQGGGRQGGDLYIGAAGHCFLPADYSASEEAARDGEEGYDVSGITVEVCMDCTFGGLTGLSVLQGETVELGEVVYARQALPDGSQVGHDFGLVRIPEEAAHLVDPSLPQWGGPDGVSETAVPEGRPVHQYGAGVANGELFATQGSTGLSLGDRGSPESWHAAIRASPGDSGSPLVATDTGSLLPSGGAAAGVLTHLTTLGTAGTTMGRCKAMPLEDGLDLDLEVVQSGDL